MNQLILNPDTNRWVSIYSKTGKKVLKKYVNYLNQSGGKKSGRIQGIKRTFSKKKKQQKQHVKRHKHRQKDKKEHNKKRKSIKKRSKCKSNCIKKTSK